jgi:mannose-6-phosphate isomerase-like protein (cupin superfamily)
MKKEFFRQHKPFVVPTSDGKTIQEHFGLASTGNNDISIAHMIAPPGWSEAPQRPEFDEYTLMVSGRKEIEIDNEKIVLKAGESLLVRRGTRVRYANPFSEPAEYWAVCIPAFTEEKARRVDGTA